VNRPRNPAQEQLLGSDVERLPEQPDVQPTVEQATSVYKPTLSREQVDRIRAWHDRAYAEALAEGAVSRTFDYLGTSIVVPPEVMPITPMSHLLGEAVLREVTSSDRVLDMGTGSGVNAVLAASQGAQVVAVDISARSLEAARSNAAGNGVADLVEVKWSDVFSDVEGTFDLIVFDPPFRWFKPRTVTESVMCEEGYGALTRFFRQAHHHLKPGGRMLIFFGTSGDLGYLQQLMVQEGFAWSQIARDDLEREDHEVEYFTFLVTENRDRSRQT